MIVSRRIDTTTFNRKARVPKAVGYKTGGDDPVFIQPFQVPTFNLSKKMRKPIPECPAKPPTNAPLMTLQEGSDLKLGLYTPQLVGIPLKVPVYIRTIDVDPMEDADEIFTDFQKPYNYNLGIRPEVRSLLITNVNEPAPPMFRAGRPVEKMKFPIGPTQYRDTFSEGLAEMLRTRQ